MTNQLITSRDYHGKSYVFSENEYIDHVSVYGVITKNEQVLMVRDSASDRWELPGGGLESGEGIISALAREVFEETGLLIGKSICFIDSGVEYYYDLSSRQPWKSNRKFYKVDDTSGELLLDGNVDDVVEARYISISDLEDINMTPLIKTIVMAVFKQ